MTSIANKNATTVTHVKIETDLVSVFNRKQTTKVSVNVNPYFTCCHIFYVCKSCLVNSTKKIKSVVVVVVLPYADSVGVASRDMVVWLWLR